MKQIKKLFIMVLIVCLTLSQGTPVMAAKKTSAKSQITLNKTVYTLNKGKTVKLKATLKKVAKGKKVEWTSSNKKVATVSSKGKVTALKNGKATITAKVKGTKIKATCKIVVGTPVKKIKLNKKSVTIKPGETFKIKATVSPKKPSNKKVTYSSSDESVVKVSSKGVMKAVGEGTATVSAMAASGVSAACEFKVAYKSQVSNQQELNNALASKVVTSIVYTSNAADQIVIAAGNYSNKTITINAPNAEVVNNGRFAKVVINAIAQNTYIENANNVIYFSAPKGHLVVGEQGIATINLAGNGNQSLELENSGYVNDLHVPAKASLNISGTNLVPVTLAAGAQGTSISTKTELAIKASAKWNMTILPGAENTKATVDNQECMPSINGIGCIPVTVTEDQDVINVPAEMTDDLAIDQKVNVSGNIQEYNLVAIGEESYEVQAKSASGNSIYLLPYSNENRGMNAENCDTYTDGMEVTAVTDGYGNYSISDVQIGNYWLIVKKENYKTIVQNIAITSFNTEEYANSQLSMLCDEIAELENTPQISGTIADGLTGASINVAGVQVKLRSGSNNIIGTTVKTVVTDEYGRYTFTDVPAGVYTVEAIDMRQDLTADAIRYNSASTTIVVAAPYLSSDGYNFVMNQRMQSITGTGLVQFTLEWGDEESGASSDIDSHIIGPKSNGNGSFHVYYGDRNYYGEDYDYDDDSEQERYTDLDVDDVDYEGPEHTTIYKETPGIYRFYIHNFSESGTIDSEAMANSSIKVTVTIGSSVYTYYCPNQPGNLWYVCDYNSVTHTIIPKNIVSSFIGDTSDIGFTEEELTDLYLESTKESIRYELDNFEYYLNRFTDNEVKSAILDDIAAWNNQLEGLTTYTKAKLLYNKVYDTYEEVSDTTPSPYISADNLVDCNSYLTSDDSGAYYMGMSCTIISGDTLVNYTLSESDDYEATLEEITDADSVYTYNIHMVYSNGLACDYKVRLVKEDDYVTNTIQYYINECNYVLNMFDECEDITNIRSQFTEYLNNASSITTNVELDEICNAITAIKNSYEYEISVYDVSDEGIEEWWTSTDYEYDEDNDICIGRKAVLRIERSSDVTDADILGKLQVIFNDYDEEVENEITYELTNLEDTTKYQALLKVTNSVTGHTKNIYVRITEY